ncbi:MAG TPA: ComF family protein, partial [Armatimonadetes bacterium]|nr:ComF family protein [Armatimonadota bacterium]
VPVPLHPSRQRERGFNQAALLARVVGEWLNRPVLEGVLERIRDTRPQVELSGRERRQNVRGAFQAREHPYLPGATALLVDDVYTTGATVRESAFALKRQGVKRVMVLTLARVVDEYRRL